MAHIWSHLGETVSDATHHMYYRGQRIKEAYYRGEKIWGEGEERFLGIFLARLPNKRHYSRNEENDLIRLQVTKMPDKIEYISGEAIDYAGASIEAVYVDGHSKEVTNDCLFMSAEDYFAYEVSDYDAESLDKDDVLDYTGVTVIGLWSGGRVEDITADCDFYLSEGTAVDPSRALLGIVVARLPNKTTYSPGESFVYDGVLVLAVYADWHTEDVTSKCEFNPSRPVSLLNIVATKSPFKSTYAHGETLDLTGAEITAVYSNGRVADITSICEFSPDNESVV